MKINILLILILFSTFEINAQSIMKVRDVYDYNIGDVFIKKYGGIYSPPTYIKDVIVNKYINSTQDTIFYFGNSYSYTAPACSTCLATYDTILNSPFFITNLDDTIGANLGPKPNDINCIDTLDYTGHWVDSIYFNPELCGNEVISIFNIDGGLMQTDSCFWYFEASYGIDNYGRGLGYVYHYYNTCAYGYSNCEDVMRLVYFVKGTDTCGSAPSILTNIDYNKNNDFLTIYPNPSSFQTTLSFLEVQNDLPINIIDCYGNIIKNYSFNGLQLILNTSELKKGIYFIKIVDKNITYCKKLIIKE